MTPSKTLDSAGKMIMGLYFFLVMHITSFVRRHYFRTFQYIKKSTEFYLGGMLSYPAAFCYVKFLQFLADFTLVNQ